MTNSRAPLVGHWIEQFGLADSVRLTRKRILVLNFARSFLAVTLTRFKRPERVPKSTTLILFLPAHVIVNLKCRNSRGDKVQAPAHL
jgi:hypothetical protein